MYYHRANKPSQLLRRRLQLTRRRLKLPLKRKLTRATRTSRCPQRPRPRPRKWSRKSNRLSPPNETELCAFIFWLDALEADLTLMLADLRLLSSPSTHLTGLPPCSLPLSRPTVTACFALVTCTYPPPSCLSAFAILCS